MKFEQSGLPKDPILEDAFNYTLAYNKSLAPELVSKLEKQLKRAYNEQYELLNADKEAGLVDEKQYKNIQAQLDMMLKMEQKRLPQIAEMQITQQFVQTRLSPVQEIHKNSENASPVLLAAALLIGCVRDAVDHQKVESQFGGAISGLIAEVIHIDSYPGTAATEMAKASSDAKRLFMAEIIASLDQINKQLATLPPGASLILPPEQEQAIFNQVKPLWGNDKKQDERLTDTFNRVTDGLESPFKIRVKPNGRPELFKSRAKFPPVKPGKGPKIIGD